VKIAEGRQPMCFEPQGLRPRRLGLAAMAACSLAVAPASSAPNDARTNFFDDPFVRVTRAMNDCPEPEGPLYSEAEARAQSHMRAEKGTTCYYYGRCRLPNAFLYDKDIIERVAHFIERDGRFADSSVWLVGQRRFVYLQGCVPNRAMAAELVREIGLIDDVEMVVDQLQVGVTGEPPYPVAGGASSARSRAPPPQRQDPSTPRDASRP